MNIKWIELMCVCNYKQRMDCLQIEVYGYELHCGDNNYECTEANCPIWKNWAARDRKRKRIGKKKQAN